MASTQVKIAGTWRAITKASAKVAGSWVTAKFVWVRKAGVWVQVWSARISGFLEDWAAFSASYSASAATTQMLTESGTNFLRWTASNSDSQLRMLNSISLDPSVWRYWEIRYRTSTASNMQIFYMMTGRTNDFWGTEDQSFVLGVVADNTWRTITFDLWTLNYYRSYGTFTGWRFDPNGVTGGVIDIDYIQVWR